MRSLIVYLCALFAASCGDSSSAKNKTANAAASTALKCTADDCEIILRRLVTLSDSASPGTLGNRPNVQRAPSGRYFSTIADYSGVATYDSAGHFLNKFGRRGQGPGEFTLAYGIAFSGDDTLFVHDMRQGRVSVFSRDMKLLRTTSLMSAHPVSVFSDGSFLIAAQLGDREHRGWPMHIMNAGGRVIRSFGGDGSEYKPEFNRYFTREIGTGLVETVWAAAPGRYRLEQWMPSEGRLVKTVKVNAPWFQETGTDPRGSYLFERPTPIIVSVWQSHADYVWVLIATADEHWRQRVSDISQDEQPADPDVHDASFDYLLQAVELSTGTIVASLRLDKAHYSMPPSNLIVSHGEATLSNVAVDVWEPVLQRKAKGN